MIFPRVLRVVLEEGLLVLQILFRRLHEPVRVGHARNDDVLAGCRAGPRIGEQLPGELVGGGLVDRRLLPRTIVHFDFDRLDGCAVVQDHATGRELVARARDARDERLELHAGHRSLGPLHLAVDHLAAKRAVPARLILAEVLILLRVNLRQPLHVGDPVPARHDQSEREALMLRERLAVHQIRQDRFTRERLLAREAAAELLVDGELLRAELDFLVAAVGAEEDELFRFALHAGLIEHGAQRHARPVTVAAQPLKWTTIAGALEAEGDLRALHLLQIVERERQRLVHQAGHLQPKRRGVHVRVAVVLRREERISAA